MTSDRRQCFAAARPRAVSLILGCGLAIAAAPVASGQVQWRSGPQTIAVQMNATSIEREIKRLTHPESPRHIVIQLSGPTTQSQRDTLASMGVRPVRALGGNAYLATVAPSVNAQRAASSGLLTHVEELPARRKMHPDLNAGILHDWMIVEDLNVIRDKAVGEGLSPEEIEKRVSNPLVAVYVSFHDDVDALGAGFNLVQQMGGEVISVVESINTLVVHMSRARIEALANEDSVMWIEPPLPRMSPTNDSVRQILGTETINAAPYGLTGAGVRVLVYDAGTATPSHPDLAGRLTIGDSSGTGTHASHVAGTVAGSGAASSGTFRGQAPAAHIVAYGFEVAGGLQPGFLYTDPGDLEADYNQAINTHSAHISNNSIGSNVESNGYNCAWQGDYGVTASLIDAIVRGSLGSPMRIVWAGGNERQGSRCNVEGHGQFYSIAPPGSAKNHITVGALNSNDDSMTSFSSWGPTDDGRIKPDISGPGCQSNGDSGVTSMNGSSGYTVMCGTSMASPAVAGVSALLIEQWRLSRPSTPDMRNATLKAILANSAVDRGNAGPDYQFGYGSVRAQPAADTIIQHRVIETPIAQGQTQFYIAVVEPGQSELKVTVAWDDVPATPLTNNALINDIDLRIVGPTGTIHMPWTLNPANPSAPAVQTTVDRINNIEQVAIVNPAPGAYRIEVVGFNIAQGPDQPVGIASSHQLFACSSEGIVAMSGSRFACSAVINIDVIDCDLNADDNVIDIASVNVSSTSDPIGITVQVTEIGPEVAVFQGSITISGSPSFGQLLVQEGDTITVTYIDADDGLGGSNVLVTANAIVDCTPPNLIATNASEVLPRSAVIDVEFDEPARTTLWYGTSPGSLTSSVERAQGLTTHAIPVAGLVDNTTYYYAFDMQDLAGNTSFDDNGGQAYAFTTPEVPDFFTQQFTSGSALVGKSVTFYAGTSTVDYYTSCAELLSGGLPTDPAGGTAITLGDDSSVSILVGSGQSVSLYGTAYTSFFVGSNGYITFGSGDSTYSESLAAHFDRPRISGWFDDLNPGAGGQVSYKQLPDRMAVTWLNVPEYSTTNSNTFQIELFFDGMIRISYLNMASQDGIAGLSAGGGLDPDFFPSDLASTAGCGPRPPSASHIAVQTPVGQAVGVTLQATDDGLPHGTLEYIVTSLPAGGQMRDAGTNAAINTVPYVLSGDSVTYTPPFNYQGNVTFNYRADDGGTPPDGGLSNVATVTVTIGGPQVIYQFLVDDTNPGWSTMGQWAFGQPTGQGSGNRDPNSGFTGLNVYGYNLNGDYPNNLAEQYLTTNALDFTDITNVKVSFERWLAIESATYDRATVRISNNDGATWTTIWSHTGGSVSPSSWTSVEYDISQWADNQPNVRLRWVMGTTDSSVVYPGWNIDDIRFWGVVPLNPCLADFNGDGEIDFFDVQLFLTAFSSQNPIADLNGDQSFDFFDVQIFLQAFSAGCP